MEYKQSLRLDVSGRGRPQKVTAKQWDTESRTLEIMLTSNGAPFAIPEGAVVRLRATKPDNTCVLNDCEIRDGIVVIPLTEQLLASSGLVRADLALYEGESLLSTTHFIIQVIHAPIDYEAVESADEFTALNNALTAIEDSAALAEKAAASMEGLLDDCELASSAANQSAVRANTAAQAANSAAQRAEAAADACDAFVGQEIGDVVDAAIGSKVDSKVEEAVTGIVGRPNGVAGLDSSGKITPMPTASDVGAASSVHSHTIAEVSGTVSVSKGGTGAATAAAALTNLGAAAASHQHKTSDITSGVLPVARGGTGASTAALARYALGLGNTSGPVPIANGGTGASTAANALQSLGAQPLIEDSGWITLPLNEDVTARSIGGFEVPMYRNLGGHVMIQGGVTVTSDTMEITIATLPSGFCPASTVHKMVPCGGHRIARIYVTPLGEVVLEWMMNIADGTIASVNQWLVLNIDYYRL